MSTDPVATGSPGSPPSSSPPGPPPSERLPPGPPRFCTRCGAPLHEGARFCQHCGTPLPGPGAPGSPGMPRWPRGPLLSGQIAAGRHRKNWFSRLPSYGKAAVVFGGLVLLGALIQSMLPGHPHCAYSCGPDQGPIAPAGQHYASSLGFAFDYPTAMSAAKPEFRSLVTLDDNNGQLMVWAGQGQQSLGGLVQTYSQMFSGDSNFTGFNSFGTVSGAEIGFIPGQGEFYSSDIAISGQETPVGVVVIAAQSAGLWAVVAGWSVCVGPSGPAACTDPSFRSGGAFASGSDFDDVLARWHWPGQ
ncbi:MAG TPA: zinc ribbon domain-containing protein [Acidimicrobiales bacterium]|nr:zinc ribbon domain-containing protein [Acidimicrobiales bacterium]